MGPSIKEGHPKSLAGADGYVDSQFPWRLEDAESQEVRGTHCQRSKLMRLLHHLGKVHDASLRVGVLEQDSGDVLLAEVGFEDVGHLNIDSKRKGSSLDAADGLRMEFLTQDEPFTLVGSEKQMCIFGMLVEFIIWIFSRCTTSYL